MPSTRRVIRGLTPAGDDVALVLDVTSDRLIGMFAKTDGPVLLTPRQIDRFVGELRELQASALQGITWPVG